MCNRIFYLLSVLTCIALPTSCTDDNNQNFNNPLVGLWEEAVTELNQDDPRYSRNCYPEGPDAGFGGTWLFENDGSYQLEFGIGTIAGPRHGLSSGTYELTSDSILALHVTYYEFEDSVYTGELEDTHYVAITDTMFTERISNLDCLVYWRKIK